MGLDMMGSDQKVWPAEHRQMLDHGAEGEGREEGEAADDQDDADEEADEEPAVGRERAGRGRDGLLGREAAGDGERRDDDEEAAHQHRDPERQVVPGRVAGQAAEGRAVVRRRRGVGVEDLREAVRAGVGDRGDGVRQHHGDRR